VARTVIVSGGGSGIGKSVVMLCAGQGDHVAILDKERSAAEEAAAQAMECGASGAVGFVCDVTREAQVEESFAEVQARFGTPSGIFASAGIDVGGLIHELSLQQWRSVMDTNVTGVFLVCKYSLRHLLKSGVAGSIVCASSPAASVAFAAGGCGPYAASKGAISALVRCMAIDYASKGIRVNAIVPGATETGMMWSNVPRENISAVRQQLEREIPLGRLAQPDDPARAVMWLLSEQSSYVTGSHLICDGGILAKASISV